LSAELCSKRVRNVESDLHALRIPLGPFLKNGRPKMMPLYRKFE
jgi:hypothetical protein